MCFGCWKDAGSPMIMNDRVKAAVEATNRLYETHLAGGGMHIVTDDWNCDDSNVSYCRDYMTGGEYDADESEIACLVAFEALTEDERYSALAVHEGFTGA